MNTHYISAFEQQKAYFNDFVEEFQDRMDILLEDGIEIIFDKTFIQFNDLVVINYSKVTLVPELFLKQKIYKKSDIILLQKILANFQEITSRFREYLLIFNHLKEFTNKATKENQYYSLIVEGLKEIQINDPHMFDGKIFYLLEDMYEGKTYKIYLKINEYGGAKKQNAEISYILEDKETHEEQLICSYSIAKPRFVEDVAHQLAYNKCTHLVDIK